MIFRKVGLLELWIIKLADFSEFFQVQSLNKTEIISGAKVVDFVAYYCIFGGKTRREKNSKLGGKTIQNFEI